MGPNLASYGHYAKEMYVFRILFYSLSNRSQYPVPISKQYWEDIKGIEEPPSVRKKVDEDMESNTAKGAPRLSMAIPEKKRLHWEGLTCRLFVDFLEKHSYSVDLAPLTTVGNL